jgi:hypothetical protein
VAPEEAGRLGHDFIGFHSQHTGGHMWYQNVYLQSDHWLSFRADILRIRPECQICHTPFHPFCFARAGAVVGMNMEDYFQEGKRWWFRLHEKGGKRHEVPAHHNAEAYVDAYLAAAQIAADRKGPLFRSLDRERHLTERRLHRLEVLATPAPTCGVCRCDQAPRPSSRTTTDDLLPYLPGHGHYHLPPEWWYNRACAADCESRIAAHNQAV